MASYTGSSRDVSRIQHMEEERKRKKEDMERQKTLIAEASSTKYNLIDKFASRKDSVEDLLKRDTVGLVSFDAFKARREYLERCAVEERERIEAAKREQEALERKRRLKKANTAQLSFAADEEEDDGEDEASNTDDRRARPQAAGKDAKTVAETEEKLSPDSVQSTELAANLAAEGAGGGSGGEGGGAEAPALKKRKFGKNPAVDTKFLPDRDRELAQLAERERLRQQWENEQRAMKEQIIKITYSYWDGAGHRRVLKCKIGTTVGKFLAMVQQEFHDLRNVSADMLMFIKEDLIIPHHYSFYDFIVTKARGKSGPLFNFDVHEDVRLLHDATKEKEDAHAGKVVERRWYDRNKHIFPASRWEVYDPTKKYERYTIHGGEVR